MGKERSMLHLMTEAMDAPQELLPGASLIEIAGNRRVLIENHRGVLQYERDLLRVRLIKGAAVIRGSGLTIARMSKRQLVVTGGIDGVDLERGAGC